jgi:hypothetical protein
MFEDIFASLLNYIWYMPFVLIALYFFWMIIDDAKNAKKALVLHYQSEKQAELIDIPVRQGVISHGKDKHYVDEEDATLIKGSGHLVKAFRPFYVIKWNEIMPQNFTKSGIKAMSPENLENFMNNKTLAQLLTPQDAEKQKLFYIAAGVIVGTLLMYSLGSSGFIQIG